MLDVWGPYNMFEVHIFYWKERSSRHRHPGSWLADLSKLWLFPVSVSLVSLPFPSLLSFPPSLPSFLFRFSMGKFKSIENKENRMVNPMVLSASMMPCHGFLTSISKLTTAKLKLLTPPQIRSFLTLFLSICLPPNPACHSLLKDGQARSRPCRSCYPPYEIPTLELVRAARLSLPSG